MSTKLYNGYKLNELSIRELKEFMDEIKSRLHKVFVFNYETVFVNMGISLIDDCITYDYLFNKTKDATDIEKFFLERLRNAYNPFWMIDEFYGKRNDLNVDFAINQYFNFEFIGSIKNVTNEMIKQKIFVGKTKQMNMAYLDFQNEIALFPTDGKMLFLAYGNTLESVLQKILNSKKKTDREFRKKYGFEYYGYWNNTDMPNGMSQKRWDARGDEWNEVLNPDYIPSLHGICSEFISEEQFLNEMNMNIQLKGNYINPATRAEKVAIQLVRNNWIETQKVTVQNVVSIVEEFDELRKKGTFDKEIEEITEDLKKLLPVIDEKTFSKKLIDFAPNYKQFRGI